MTAQAGPGLLHADGLKGRGVRTPQLSADTTKKIGALLPPITFQANPVDTGRPDESFFEIVSAIAADPDVDLVSVYALTEPEAFDLAAQLDQATGQMVVGLGGPPQEVEPQRELLRKLSVPVLSSPKGLTTAVCALVEDARAQRRWRPRSPTHSSMGPISAWNLDEDGVKTLLEGLGVRTLSRRVCIDHAAAHQALAELGRPVAVKLLDANITHKSDVGGVHLGIADAAQLDAALDALGAIGASRFLVEEMASPGVDLIAGASQDPVFGPMVLLGIGGVVAEAFADVALLPAPTDPEQAGELVDELDGRKLFEGFRGGPVADRRALGDVLASLGDLVAGHDEVQEVEVNPLRLTHDGGLIALDAVLIVKEDR